LAELLNPDPPLIPTAIEDQITMFGLAQLIVGEGGFGWTTRIAILHHAMTSMRPGDPDRTLWLHAGEKYLYTAELGAAAPTRMAEIVATMHQRIEAQKIAGSHYCIGDHLSAIDLYWACFAAVLQPLSAALCPMGEWPYSNPDAQVQAVLSPLLLEHRDYIYEKHLELPIVF
jgi:glutathione S-transferase